MKVKNINGTSQLACPCGSWLNHWLTHSARTAIPFCAVSTCLNRATVGAHVKVDGVAGWCILPFCDGCNKKTGDLETFDGYMPVLANKAYTCKRP